MTPLVQEVLSAIVAQRHLLPLVGTTSARCPYCGQRFRVRKPGGYWTKRPHDKEWLELGIEGIEGSQSENRMFETYCSLNHAKRHRARTLVEHDAWQLGRRRRTLLQRCHQGHPFTAENTYITSRGWFQCRACHLLRERARRQRSRQANTCAS